MSFSYSDYDDDLDLAYLSPEEEVFDLSAVMPDMDRLKAVDKPIPVTSPMFRQLPPALRSPTHPQLGTTGEVGSVPEVPRPDTPVDTSGVPLTTPLGLSTPQPRLRRPSPPRTDPVPVAVGRIAIPVQAHDGGGDRSDRPDAVLRKSSSLNLRAFISPRPANTTVAELRARAQVVLDRLAVKRKESLEFFAKLAAGDQDPDELGEIFLSPSRGITSLPATAIPSHQDLHTPIRPRRSPLATEGLISAVSRPDPDRLEAAGPAAGSSDDPVVTSPSQISPDFTRLMDNADLGAVSPPSVASHPAGDSRAVPTGTSLLVRLSEARSAPRPSSPAEPANTVPRGLPSAPSIARHHPFRPQPRLVGRIFTLLDGWSRIDRRTVLLQRREPSSQVLPVNDLLAPDQTVMERCTTIVISPDEPGRLVDPAVRSLLADSVPEFYRVLQSPRRHRRVPRAPQSDDRSAPRPASPTPPTRLRRPSTRTRYFQPVKLSKPALSFTVTPSDLDPAALDPRDIEALADRSLCGLNVRYLINGYLHAKRDWREPSPLPLDPAPSQARPPGTNTNRHLPPRGHASLLKSRRWLSPTIEPSLRAQPPSCSPVPPTSPLSLESGTFPCSSQDGQWIHPNQLPTPYQLPTVDRSQTSLASSSFGGTLGPTSPRFSAAAEPPSPAGTHLPGSTKHTSGDGPHRNGVAPPRTAFGWNPDRQIINYGQSSTVCDLTTNPAFIAHRGRCSRLGHDLLVCHPIPHRTTSGRWRHPLAASFFSRSGAVGFPNVGPLGLAFRQSSTLLASRGRTLPAARLRPTYPTLTLTR
ncbi:hypothetical protein IWQ60_004184 [Tieghemiomyces parasiticus]|uniref:Uncharacterized protein n=1 Tax=Tieghemiomyces parasiticus TaxID=78921 RepID=A0A9W8DZK5_9FUNG|nr:hypothetical protein IWQ60_004184 [Tieghemiomyces parasiticus]